MLVNAQKDGLLCHVTRMGLMVGRDEIDDGWGRYVPSTEYESTK